MAEALVPLWLGALALMGSPGPATLGVAGVGVAFGVRRGLPYFFGIVLGTSTVLVLIATGVTALLLAEPALVAALTAAAAAYILYLAWRIATAPVGARASRETPAPAFAAGLALAIANPKAFAAIGALFSGHTLVEGSALLDAAAKVAALAPVIVAANTAWLVFGSSLATVLTEPRTGRIANIVFAALLVASAAVAAYGLVR